MNKLFLNLFKAVMIIALMAVTLQSCVKDDRKALRSEAKASEVEIDELKKYMAKLINANINDISYNEKTKQFSLWGVEQFSRQDLTKFYENSKRKAL